VPFVQRTHGWDQANAQPVLASRRDMGTHFSDRL
jgi:hypothetical protein